MERLRTAFLGIAFGALCGCDADKVNRLEKQNEDLKAQVVRQSAMVDLDLQARCSKDAKNWYTENWGGGRDKETILLDYTNHYNKALNKCFIHVEYHHNTGPRGSWANDMSLWDVYENSKYGDFTESHYAGFDFKQTDSIFTCEVA